MKVDYVSDQSVSVCGRSSVLNRRVFRFPAGYVSGFRASVFGSHTIQVLFTGLLHLITQFGEETETVFIPLIPLSVAAVSKWGLAQKER